MLPECCGTLCGPGSMFGGAGAVLHYHKISIVLLHVLKTGYRNHEFPKIQIFSEEITGYTNQELNKNIQIF